MSDYYDDEFRPEIDPQALIQAAAAAAQQSATEAAGNVLAQYSGVQYNIARQQEVAQLAKRVDEQIRERVPALNDPAFSERVAGVAAGFMPQDGTETEYVQAIERAARIVAREDTEERQAAAAKAERDAWAKIANAGNPSYESLRARGEL